MLLAKSPRERAERDHAEEDAADDQHGRDDVAAFGGGVGEEREHGASLTDALGVGGHRTRDARRVGDVVAETET